eukprot:54466-Rhodomonas_salina.1
MGIRAANCDNELDGLIDNESLLSVIEAWIGNAHHPSSSPANISDADIVLPLIRKIGLRTQPTRLWKLKSH